MDPLAHLIDLLLEGDQLEAVVQARGLAAAGVAPERIVSCGLERAMELLDAKCTVDQYNLLEIMLVGRAVTAVIKALFPGDPPPPTRGTVVLASLEGDVHDLGKNITRTILEAKGYRVVDCGKDCPVDALVGSALREGADFIGISGLISTVVPLVREVKAAAAAAGIPGVKVLAGGATLRQCSAESLAVDFVAQSVFDGVRYLDDQEEGP